jgi:restriction endonuclease S subunit
MNNTRISESRSPQKQLHLDQICSIHSGCNATISSQGNVRILQPRNFEAGMLNLSSEFLLVEESPNTAKHKLVPGALLFASKGASNFVWRCQGLEADTVASTSFFVLYLKTNLVLPEYLTALLNSPSYQHQIGQLAQGGTVKSIPKSSISRILIPIPPFEIQRKISRLSHLVHRKNTILMKIIKNEIECFDSYVLAQILPPTL